MSATTTAPAPFDVCGALPTGTVVLEASAGTGKTFTIAALVARYVAGGLPLDRLLVVTFTRNATGELRERVRDRLVTTERALRRAAAGAAPGPGEDDIARLLAATDPATAEVRRRLVATALSDFDAATIATTHGFCQHILSGLGVAGDAEEDPTFVENADDLVEQVVDDLYVRRFAPGRDDPPFGRDEALRIGRLAVEHAHAPVEPAAAPAGSAKAMRRRLALAVRDEVERRKRQLGVVTYDDLLTRLADTLRDPGRGPAARARLRRRYRVALVDEFQDTDPVQWEIMRLAFASPGGGGDDPTLVLIGDPKQAIYSFRGADVHAYLAAASEARHRATLATNWRSDQGLIDACDAVLGGTRLGHDDIVHRTVGAAPGHERLGLAGGPDPAPLRVRVAGLDGGDLERTPKGFAAAGPARHHVAADLATDVVGLLGAGATVAGRRTGPHPGPEPDRPLRPGDLAVLVRTHRQGTLVHEVLAGAGVPTVLGGAGSVFDTTVARQWLALLEALERPSSPARARAAALGPFIGWDADALAGAGDERWEQVHARLHGWAAVLRRRGVASLVDAVTAAEGIAPGTGADAGGSLPARVLTRPDGERTLTDLRHVAELLHGEAAAAGLGVTALAGWLRRRIAGAEGDGGDETRLRRLESDAEAVQVLTVHRSKGLEFPVVYLPFLWEPGWVPDDGLPVYHDPGHGRRTIDVSHGGRELAEHRLAHLAEQRGEDLRLAYVALTRARHQVVLWWAGSWESRNSPLGRLITCRDADGHVTAEGRRVPDEQEVAAWFGQAAGSPGLISVAPTTGGDGRRWVGAAGDPAALVTRAFTRSVDADWQRTSYSALTAAAHEGAGGPPGAGGAAHEPEPGEDALSDESMPAGAAPARPPDAGGGDDPAAGTDPRWHGPVPLATLPGGTEVGSLLHAVLEAADFDAADLDAELDRRLGIAQTRAGLVVEPRAAAVTGLRRAIETPLGPLAGGLALRAVGRRDRLDELAFELPLAGGDTPGGAVTVAAVAQLLRDRVPAGDPLAGYADRLDVPELARTLRGYLTGSIDVVLRLGAGARFVIVDHKTNWLGVPGEDLTAWHYRPAALVDAMQRAHYPLQGLLYAVALHRYLRGRMAAYDPDRHLGGVLYLFLRGMTGAEVPHVDGQPCGVFSWAPPAGLVPALSDLLDEGAP